MKKLKRVVIALSVWLVLWGMAGVLGMLPSPRAAAAALGERTSMLLLHDIAVSTLRFMAGYLIAAIAGVALGVVLGWFITAWEYIDPIVQLLRPMSPIAWLPLLIVWFGANEMATVGVVFFASFFPILLNTVASVRRTAPEALRKRGIFDTDTVRGLLHASFPQVATGLHIGVGTGWIFLIAAESLNAVYGLGVLIGMARKTQRIDLLLGAMVMVGVCATIADFVLRRLEKPLVTCLIM